MELLAFNLSWMLFNLILALFPVALTLVLDKKLDTKIRYFVLFLWILFLPNTIYLITDIQYLPGQLGYLSFSEKIVAILMYAIIIAAGIITYMFSLKPWENTISKVKSLKKNKLFLYVILNFVISFAVILGKFERTHSWYVFTQPFRVIEDVYAIIIDSEMLVYIVCFGIVVNIIFFLTKKYFSFIK